MDYSNVLHFPREHIPRCLKYLSVLSVRLCA